MTVYNFFLSQSKILLKLNNKSQPQLKTLVMIPGYASTQSSHLSLVQATIKCQFSWEEFIAQL